MVAVRKRPTEIIAVKNSTNIRYVRNSVSRNSSLTRPLKINRYWSERLTPPTNIKRTVTYSISGEANAAMLACFVEKPPVDTADIE